MTVFDRIEHFLSTQASVEVFLRTNFRAFGSASQVGRALNELVERGNLVRLGVGIYAKAKPSVLSGKPIPVRPLDVLAPKALERLGVEIGEARLVLAYNSGRSTQIPAGVTVNIGTRRITRKLGFNGNIIWYERA